MENENNEVMAVEEITVPESELDSVADGADSSGKIEGLGGTIALIGLAIVGATWIGKSAWKYAIKPGCKAVRNFVNKRKAKDPVKPEADVDEDVDESEESEEVED